MGGGCYRVANRNLFFVGGYCENSCFQNYGGCEASSQFIAVKTESHCELKPETKEQAVKPMEEINQAVELALKQGSSIFLYTPDMFSDFYYKNCFLKLPERHDPAYLAINAGVRTLMDVVKNQWEVVYKKGIREIWMGVETADAYLREKYNKPVFSNEEVISLTKTGREAGINMSWFLVDGEDDSNHTRLATFQLIKKADPYRVHIGQLRRY